MATDIFYSVGQNTSDHKTGSPTVTISSGVATFSVAQTATNLGVGDQVNHAGGDGVCYLASKVTTSQWNVVSATGGTPTNVTSQSVTSIVHCFASLNAAEAGVSGLLGTEDLVANDYLLHLSCYYDTGADTARVEFDSRASTGWQTDSTRYVHIYTPHDTDTECNQSQRNLTGLWSSSYWRMEFVPTGNYQRCFTCNGYYADSNPFFCHLEYIQLKLNNSGGYSSASTVHEVYNANATRWIEGCILQNIGGSSIVKNNISTSIYHMWNCILFGDSTDKPDYGYWTYNNSASATCYNNIISKCSDGIRIMAGGTFRNNALVNNSDDYYGSSYSNADTLEYNASTEDTSETGWVDLDGNAGGEWDDSFEDWANDDYRCPGVGSLLVDEGTSAVSGTVSDDIKGVSRPQNSVYDIGAFELPFVTGSGAATLPAPTASGSGTLEHPGSGALTLPVPEVSGSGSFKWTGTGAIGLPVPEVSGAGTVEHPGSGAVTLPVPQASGSGTVEHPGSGALTLPVPEVSGAGVREHPGTGALTLPVPEVAGSGTLTHAGSGAITLPIVEVAGSGSLNHAGTGDVDLPVPEVAGSGGIKHPGTGALTLPVPTVAGSGIVKHMGSGAITLPLVNLAGSGSLGHVGSGALNLPVPTASGSGGITHIGTGNINLPVPSASGEGIKKTGGTGAITLPIVEVLGGNNLFTESVSLDSTITRTLSLRSHLPL